MTEKILWMPREHTVAKLAILKKYLEAWMPILARYADKRGGRPLYIDAFAGPGEYIGGDDGSPVVAIEAAKQHAMSFGVPIEMAFVEKDNLRHQHLQNLLERRYGTLRPGTIRNVVVRGVFNLEAEVAVRRLLNETQREVFTPTLVFLDQFGYSDVPIDLIKDILGRDACETFSFLNWQRLNPYLTDPTKAGAIHRAFGSDEWREVIDLHGPRTRSDAFITLYEEALKNRAGATYIWRFAMHGPGGELLYWLVFCSRNPRGLEVMKKAMWSVDPAGSYTFSDKHAGQFSLFSGFDDQWLAGSLAGTFRSRRVSLSDIRDHVLTETPCHQFSKALARLEDQGVITVIGAPPSRRRGAFGPYVDDLSVEVSFSDEAHVDEPQQRRLF